mgnify:CR=1 FL=1
MKKANVHAKSQRAIAQEQEKQEELQKIEAEKAKKKTIKKQMMKTTVRLMFGIYSILFAALSWLVDWMGVLAAASLVLSLIGIYKTRQEKDRYYWFCVAAAVLSGIRLIWEIIDILKYLIK